MNKKNIFNLFSLPFREGQGGRLLLVLAALLLCFAKASAQEAYAVYTSDNTTLTFYYDTQRSSRTGTTYILNTGSNNPGWYDDGTNASVTQVVFNPSFANARPTSTSLWFCDMKKLQTITGMSYLNTSSVTNMAYMFDSCFSLTSLDLSNFDTSKVYSMYYMFAACIKLTSLDVSSFNTAKVTNMSCMFMSCTGLTSLDVSSFNTAKVTDMKSMFYSCDNLSTIYVGTDWSTSAVKESEGMFHGCEKLVGGQGTRFSTSNPDDKSYAHVDGGASNPGYLTASETMPYACYTPSTTTLTFYYDTHRSSRIGKTYILNTGSNNPGWYDDGTNASVTQVVFNPSFANARPTSTSLWFCDMKKLQTITGMSYLNTSSVTNMAYMFDSCFSLTSLDLSNFDTSKVYSMYYMFAACIKLTSLDVSSFNTAKVTNMSCMFMSCTGLTSLDVSSFNTAKVTDMKSMFYSCDNLSTIYVGTDWSTSAVKESEGMFHGCEKLVGGQGTRFSTSNPDDKSYAHVAGGASNPGYLTAYETMPYACYTPSTTTLTFYYDKQRSSRSGTTYDLNTGTATPGWKADGSNASVTCVVFDSSFAEVRPMTTYRWFDGMENLTEILGISNLNTSEVTNMSYMFNNCSSLTSLDVSHFDTRNVTNMSNLFCFCSGLTSLNLSTFNTANVTNMSAMFNNCRSLTSLDLSHFNTAKVTNMSNMFSYCTGLKSVDLSSFNTALVTNMFCMFDDCSGLTSLDLSSFNTSRVTNMTSMFESCRNLVTILVGSGWSTAAVSASDGMFSLCTSLVGGKGTDYSGANPTDKTYAHVDGGFSNPGYLTDKGDPYVVLSSDGKTMTFLADGKRLLHTETTYNALTAPNNEWDYSVAVNITKVVFDPSFASARPTCTEGWFSCMFNLKTITGLEYLNTSELKYMGQMFSSCRSLTTLDLSHFDTSKVIEMYNLFEDCRSLTSLDLSHFNTANVEYMNHMFEGCSSLTTLDLSSFNTSKVKDMEAMFAECTSLTTIYVSDGSDGWNTSSVTAVNGFENMFLNCRNIVGGMGTTFDSVYIGEDAAHIDQGDEYPGYLTDIRFLTDPYAVLSADGKTLTFYHDGQRVNHLPGKTYSLDWPAGDEPYWFYDDSNLTITNVVFDASFADVRPTSTYYWFGEMADLESITGIEYLNTSEVTNMSFMFYGCQSLTSLDVSYFDTQKVTNMAGMFNGCSELMILEPTGFDTRNVTDMSSMFSYCNNLRLLDIRKFDTQKVTDMSFMFGHCENLGLLDVDRFNTAQVENMYSMFGGCEKLVSLDLSNFNTAKVTDMSRMFSECIRLRSLDLRSFNTANVTNMGYMFTDCIDLQTISVEEGWNTGKVTNSRDMFKNCPQLVGSMGTTHDPNHVDKEYARIDGGESAPGYLSGPADYITNPYVAFSADGTTMTFLYDGRRTSQTGKTYSLNEAGNMPAWVEDQSCEQVTTVVFDESFADLRPTSTNFWFYAMTDLTTITNLDNLNTSEVTTMNSMFDGCMSLTSLDLSSFDTRKVTDMSWMFAVCRNLTSLDVSCFDTRNVTSMRNMFWESNSLTRLDLGGFNTSSVEDVRSMFENCTNLKTIFVGSRWDLTHVSSSDNMFSGCTSLVGGKGTTFDASHIDKTYARIDNAPSAPGYLTDYDHTPYVIVNGTTMTFYHDGQRGSRSGKTYSLNEGDEYPGWYYDDIYWSITKVVFDESFADVRPTTTFAWFGGMVYLTAINGMENLNTSEVTNMTHMFNGCYSLTSLDLTGFDTSKVTYMGGMFQDCSSLTSLDLSNFDTHNVTRMFGMFWECSSLTGLDLSNFNTQNVTRMEYMFCGCSSLTDLDVSSFDTQQVKKMNSLFSDCESLTLLDLSSFNTSSLESVYSMFQDCTNLKTIIVGDEWDISNVLVNSSTNMFNGCTSIVGSQGTTYDASHIDKTYAHIDGGASNPGYFSEKPDAYAVLSTDNSTLTFYCDRLKDSRTGKKYELNEGENAPGWNGDGSNANVTKVVFDESFAQARPTSTASWFAAMSNLTTITGIENLDTRDVMSMRSMFYGCSALTTLDVSHFNTRNVTSMRTMFYNCSGLTSLDVSHFDTRNVTNMYNMFWSCSGLTSIDVSNFDTRNVTTMSFMFAYCSVLANLDVSHFNTQNVTDMSFMFAGRNQLTNLDLTGFDTQNVTTMRAMFDECHGLTQLDLSSFNTANVTDMGWMFENCENLTSIFVNEGWNTDNVTQSKNMFIGCTSLVGGKNTVFDENHIDKDYARIDGGASAPGYLTEKIAFLLGDVNGDGMVDVADITALTNHFKGTTGNFNSEAADVDGDGQVTSADIPALVNLVLTQ